MAKPTSKDSLKKSPNGHTLSHSDDKTPSRSDDKTPKQQKGTYTLADGSLRKRKTFYLSVPFARKFAAYCAERGLEQSEFVRQVLAEAIGKN